MKLWISPPVTTARSRVPSLPGLLISLILSILLCFPAVALAQGGDDAAPPSETVKLIFIHHSTGENWLTDGYGNLGRTLAENNYFVSDTNYGWGPDAIGDRTDILNWPEWFRAPNTEQIMAAVYNEGGQHSSYTRTVADPGGENTIVMFKSCFPNSEIHGSPDDPPSPPAGELTVGAAKGIYTDLLEYFKTRPDKLFVVITAPPLSDGTYAANARAFNEWLVNRWLADAGYTLPNVAVWDFYNVLTGQDHHSRFHNGAIEHTYASGRNTLVYPSGDDHPSELGSQKATAEFVPMLNVFYNRWVASAPAAPVEAEPAAAEAEPAEAEPAEGEPAEGGANTQSPPSVMGLIDDFEGGNPAGTDGWQAYKDENLGTMILCEKTAAPGARGAAALHMTFKLEKAEGWASCDLPYASPLDWSAFSQLSFTLRAAEGAAPFSVLIHTGSHDAMQAYHYRFDTLPAGAEEWSEVHIPLGDFKRVDWEENAGSPLEPRGIISIAFVADPGGQENHAGEIWIDDLRLSTGAAPPAQAAPPAEPSADEAMPDVGASAGEGVQAGAPQAEAGGKRAGGLPFCPGSLGAAFMVAAAGMWFSLKRGGPAGR